ncbi:hypothetical protein [Defluviicoccus vanus]|uniref:Uncharacterized protein n=1 Tax=Defluviicoccus vanus TaxID=111831 RepID=A0A7H1MZ40_9PROT|nr:hypothetical protein [Defluviicoccus vanus]QNT68726.1 hypothetical protein HQ394_04275 [Defluviicoccus vanus]
MERAKASDHPQRRLDHGDGGEPRHRRFIGISAVRREPGDVMAHRMPASLDPAVVGVGGLAAMHAVRWRVGEECLDICQVARQLAFSKP